MKELSIEEKAKAYDEALKVLHKYDGAHIMFTQDLKEEMFPELAEPEDEKIRKELLQIAKESEDSFYMVMTPDKRKRLIDWLEKQAEQESADKVEPKFHEGDWVIDKQGIVHQIANVIENVTYHTYGYILVGGGYFVDSTEGVRLWTIQDAKDGDVLSYREGQWIFIYKEKIDDAYFYYHALYSTTQGLTIANVGYTLLNDAIIPATKEQRDILIKAMTDDGYTFDFEKKELKEVEQKPADKYKEWYDFIRWFVKQRTDDYTLIPSNDDIHKWGDNILNHARKVFEQEPAEWSEEDEKILNRIIHICEDTLEQFDHTGLNDNIDEAAIHWLKSLKDRVRLQTQWKPNDEQMKALENAMSMGARLDSLYTDLKKLKEE